MVVGCELVPIDSNEECGTSDGGIYKTCLVDCDKVVDFIFDEDGCVVNVVVSEVGAIVCYEYDDDDSSSYNQTGERTNNKHITNQVASFKYAGVSKQKIAFANGIKDCCCLYAFHFFNSGAAVVQGIDYDKNTATWKKSKKRLKATVSVLSDTGENEDRIEVSLESTGRCFSPFTSLTCDALEAL